MNILLQRKTVSLFASAVALAAGALTVGAGNADAASAAPVLTAKMVASPAASGVRSWTLYSTGGIVGRFDWSQDPNGRNPGDAFRVTDLLADGWGVEASMGDGRYATTSGHNSPYTSPWSTGNLPEGNTYNIWVYLERDGHGLILTNITVTS